MTTDPNPMRAPWRCTDGIVITDCEGKVVAVVARGQDASAEARCKVLASAPRLLDALRAVVKASARYPHPCYVDAPDAPLPPIEQHAAIGNAMILLSTLEMKP